MATATTEAKCKVYPVQIPTYPGVSETRWFLEVQSGDGRWHDVGNDTDKRRVMEMASRIDVTETSWRDRGTN